MKMNSVDVMNRAYCAGNARIEVDELADVLAIRSSRGSSEKTVTVAMLGLDEIAARVDWKAFEKAGWVFVSPTAELWQALNSGTPIPEDGTVHRVYLRAGRLLLGTDRLTIRFLDELVDDEVREALDGAGLDVVRQMKFAPNLFEVKSREGVDPLDLSVRLSSHDNIVYAEPQFLEQISSRAVSQMR